MVLELQLCRCCLQEVGCDRTGLCRGSHVTSAALLLVSHGVSGKGHKAHKPL